MAGIHVTPSKDSSHVEVEVHAPLVMLRKRAGGLPKAIRPRSPARRSFVNIDSTCIGIGREDASAGAAIETNAKAKMATERARAESDLRETNIRNLRLRFSFFNTDLTQTRSHEFGSRVTEGD